MFFQGTLAQSAPRGRYGGDSQEGGDRGGHSIGGVGVAPSWRARAMAVLLLLLLLVVVAMSAVRLGWDLYGAGWRSWSRVGRAGSRGARQRCCTSYGHVGGLVGLADVVWSSEEGLVLSRDEKRPWGHHGQRLGRRGIRCFRSGATVGMSANEKRLDYQMRPKEEWARWKLLCNGCREGRQGPGASCLVCT